MTTVNAIERLRETEFDRQISADAKSGRLDVLYGLTLADNIDKPDISLDEFFRLRCAK